MFEFIKRIFLKKEYLEEQKIKELENKLKIERMKRKRVEEELEWYHSLGIPVSEVLDGKFDYYTHLKEKVNELRQDNKKLLNELMRKDKELNKMHEMEKLYLQKIKILQDENKLLKLATTPVVISKEDKQEDKNKDDKQNMSKNTSSEPVETKKEKNRVSIAGLRKTPLKDARETLNSINVNELNRFGGINKYV